MNRENLKILSDGLLELIPPVIPIGDTIFNMSLFSRGTSRHDLICRTAGCAVGWAPFFGIEKKEKDSFVDFSVKAFSLGDSAWQYLFSSTWSRTDNSKRGAGLRIKYYLEKGLPRNWKEQLDGKAPLLYLKYEKLDSIIP